VLTRAHEEGKAVETYTYHLTQKGAQAWQCDLPFRNGLTWREHIRELARIPAKARGCDEVRLVGPNGDVFEEARAGDAPVDS